MKNCLKFVFCLFLTACRSAPIEHPDPIRYYPVSSQASTNPASATILGALEDPGLLLANQCFLVSEVDGQWVKDLDRRKCESPISIDAGSHTIGVVFFSEDYPRGKTSLALDAIAGHRYQVRFELHTFTIPMRPKVWIDDTTTGKLASQPVEMDVVLLSFGTLSRIDENTEKDFALCSASNKDEKQNADACGRLIAANPHGSLVTVYLVTRATHYISRGEYDLALKDADQAILLKPDVPSGYTSRCHARWVKDRLSAGRNPSAALQDCNHALQLDPKDIAALNATGLIYSGIGDQSRALSYFNEALELNSDSVLTRFNRANLYLLLREYDLALRDVKMTNCALPDFAPAIATRGLVYLGLGRYDEAIADLTATLDDVKVGHGCFLYAKGQAELKKGDLTNGNTDTAEAKKAHPDLLGECGRLGINL